MKPIVRYAAADGTEFSTEEKCRAHEKECAEIATIMASFAKQPVEATCNFSNGGGFLQHDPAMVHQARLALVRIAQRHWDSIVFDKFLESPAISEVSGSGMDRMMNENVNPALWSAWQRLGSCTGVDGREFGQPYYVRHPHEATQVCRN